LILFLNAQKGNQKYILLVDVFGVLNAEKDNEKSPDFPARRSPVQMAGIHSVKSCFRI